MVRLAGIVVPGCRHHTTQRGNNCQDVFFVDGGRAYLRFLRDRSETCSAFRHVTARLRGKSPKVTLFAGGFGGFVTSTAAPIATGRSDKLPGGIRTP